MTCPNCATSAPSEVVRTLGGKDLPLSYYPRVRRCLGCGYMGGTIEMWSATVAGSVPATHRQHLGTVPAAEMLPAAYRQRTGSVPGGVGGGLSSDPSLSDQVSDPTDLSNPGSLREPSKISGARARARAIRGPRRVEEYSAEFNAFWSAYPKKKKRAEAWKNWQSFKPPADLVMAALAWQVEQHDWTKDGGKYVPKAADWIEDAGWTAKPTTASRPLSKIEQKTEEHREMFLGGREWANR